VQQSRFLDRTTPPHIATLVLVCGLGALCMNIFLPSLPAMATHFSTDYAVMQFAVSGYLAGTAVLQLVIGPLSDIFGRRPVLIGAIVVLLVGTLICAFAPNITIFMIGRLLQTAIIASFVLARAAIRDMVPMEEAASMIGYVTMGMSLVPMVGPTIGGVLNDLFGWQANFAALFILGVAVLALVAADLGETNRARAASFSEQFRAWPDLFRARRFWGYVLTATFSSGIFFAFLGGAPFVGSVLLGMTPAVLGMHFFLFAGGYMVGNYFSGRYARRFGITRMMLVGNLLSLVGIGLTLLLTFYLHQSPLAFFGPLFLVGVGNGVTLPSANAGMVSVRPHMAGSASGLGGAITVGGGALLSILAAAVLSEEAGALPLLAIMAVSALLAVVATEYVRMVDRAQARPERLS
jgi:DHA1 family bicyclomycin/chloramphenicol resistance-like MFS transporter